RGGPCAQRDRKAHAHPQNAGVPLHPGRRRQIRLSHQRDSRGAPSVSEDGGTTMSELLEIAAAVNRLLRAENILLLCHKNPDGDTLGSAGALYHALKGLGKTVAVLCADPIGARYDYMQLGLFDGSFEPKYLVAV